MLEKSLRELELPHGIIIQYVDDILICSSTKQDSDHNTIFGLNFLVEKRYQMSPNETWISSSTVKYVGYHLTQGSRSISPEQQQQKEAILNTSVPQTKNKQTNKKIKSLF